MFRINEFDLEPGPYGDAYGFKVVVTDVVNHQFNTDQHLSEAISSPLVICRDLNPPPRDHRSYMIDLTYFKTHFSKL
jgi:hypothetical protein